MSEINYQEGHETAGQAKPVAWRYRYVKKDVTDFQGKPKPDYRLPDKAMSYLARNGLISMGNVLR